MYGYICDECGARLDPGEKCECIAERKKKQQLKQEIEVQISSLQEMDYIQPKFQFC